MAEIKGLDTPNDNILGNSIDSTETENVFSNNIDTTTTQEPSTVGTNNDSMSMEEINDANKIAVTVADYNSPLVVLFGPPSCGKTMTLIRLTRYLKRKGYTVQPETSFRPSYDKNYHEMCANFDMMINNEDAAKSTAKINFMLIKVLYQGKTLCQILEGPGEYYFNPGKPNERFPKYVNNIISNNNRKIWAIMVEPDNTNKKMDWAARNNYVTKIHKLKSMISPRDKIMFVYNKIDETPFVISPGNIKYGEALKSVNYLYPNIFVKFKNENPLTKWFWPNKFDFVAFQTGYFSEASDGTLTFQEGNEIYPRKLWNVILERIKG